MQLSLNVWVKRRNLATSSVLHSVHDTEIQEADIVNYASDSEHQENAVEVE